MDVGGWRLGNSEVREDRAASVQTQPTGYIHGTQWPQEHEHGGRGGSQGLGGDFPSGACRNSPGFLPSKIRLAGGCSTSIKQLINQLS